MHSFSLLKIAVIAAAVFCLAALIYLIKTTMDFGRPREFSQAAGDGRKGIVYAFGKGMMPWEKESAGSHLPTFLGGILYHGSLLSALLYVFWHIFRLPLPGIILTLLRLVWLAGTAAGFGLFVKRLVYRPLRQISCPDDFAANLIVNLFLGLTVLYSFLPSIEPLWLIYTVFLLIYIPLGKIRHCFFFFYTRILFGLFFGRRGVFPGSHPEV